MTAGSPPENLPEHSRVEAVDAEAVYSAGTVSFLGLELLAVPGALIPRRETELLARAAIERLSELAALKREPLLVVDMCCGAGNLACAVARNVPECRVIACDLTDECVALTQKNVEKLGLSATVDVHQGDLFQALSGMGLERAVDAVVCNPPYISTGRLDARTDLAKEPREAFDGGPYGLSIHQRVMREGDAFLKAKSWLMFEFGLGQERQIELLFQRARIYEQIEFIQNEQKEPRVVVARRRQS